MVAPDNTLTSAFEPRRNLTLAADDDSRVTFSQDGRNRLASATTDGTVGPLPEVALSSACDALDRRVSMSDTPSSPRTEATGRRSRQIQQSFLFQVLP